MVLFKKDKIQLKKPVFILLGFTLYPLLIFCGLAGYFLEEYHFERSVLTELQTVRRLLDHQSDLHSSELKSLIDHFGHDPALQKAYLARSRQDLYQAALPLFHSLLNQGISHFYFTDLDKACFLRVHNPERFGDEITRHTMREAARTGTFYTGLEMGPYGTFTLRAVQPWYIDDKLAGYIELGRDIKNLTNNFKKVLDMEFFVLISKRHLDRKNWEEGLWMTGRTGNWDEDRKHIIFDRTMPGLPKELIKYLELPHEAKEDLMFRVTITGRTYRGGFVPLHDASGKELGEIIALRDCTSQMSSRTWSMLFGAGSAGMAILIFVLFYAYANNLELRLQRTYTDLTSEIESRKTAQERLKKHEEELELLVHERTRRLEQTNNQLQQEIRERIKIAEELLKTQRLESIGILAGGLAHDFNNLLTVILGNINLLAEQNDLSAEQKELLQAAEKASLQAQTLTQQLITFAKGGNPRKEIVDIAPLLQQVVSEHAPSTVSSSFELPADLWQIQGDITQLRQAFGNLIENSCEAMANKGELKISCCNQDFSSQQNLSMPAQKYIEVTIKDSGYGIPKEDLPKIFDPYFSSKTMGSSKGVGLGLSISHSIIAKHNGFIRADSQEGEGAIFTIFLPAHFTNS